MHCFHYSNDWREKKSHLKSIAPEKHPCGKVQMYKVTSNQSGYVYNFRNKGKLQKNNSFT